jgi:hypothetical protein
LIDLHRRKLKMELATASPDIHQYDLVSFGPGLRDRGIVGERGTAKDTFVIPLLDNSGVDKKLSDLTVIDRSYLNIAQEVASAADMGGQIGVAPAPPPSSTSSG